MIRSNKRPFTGWADRYAKALFSLIDQKEQEQWVNLIDQISILLPDYLHSRVYKIAQKEEKKKLLIEFSEYWQLPFFSEILLLLFHYARLSEVRCFLHAVKILYFKQHNIYQISIEAPTKLNSKDLKKLVEFLNLKEDNCHISQHIKPDLIKGMVLECDGVRYDGSYLHQIKQIQRSLNV